MPGNMDGYARAGKVAERCPDIEIVTISGRIEADLGYMPESATFIAEPFDSDGVKARLREKLPDGKQPHPLKTAV